MKREFNTEVKLYTLCILVEDTPGMLSQVARLFSRKGYNIESIVTGAADRPGLTRISIEIRGDELMIDQIAAQCRKLLPVKAVKILDEETCIRRAQAVKQRGISLLHEVDTQYSALKAKYEELLKKCQQEEDSLSHKHTGLIT